jgi:hypothetical protein
VLEQEGLGPAVARRCGHARRCTGAGHTSY